jgi:acyltransferase
MGECVLSLDNMRDTSIDIAKGIGITLVVFGHTYPTYLATSYVYAFHVPLFFFLAGYKFNLPSYQKKLSYFIRRRVSRLMLPYLIAAICSYLLYAKLAPTLSLPLITGSAALQGILRANGNDLPFNIVLWFLPALFFAEMLFLTLTLMLKRFKLFAVIMLVSATGFILGGNNPLILGLDIAMTMQFFLFFGYLCRQAKWLEEAGQSKKIGILLGIACLTTILMAVCSSANGRIDLMTRLYRQPLLFYIASLSGSISVLVVSLLLTFASNRHIGRILSSIGQASMDIFVSHIPIFYCIAFACSLLWGFRIYHTYETYWYLLFLVGVAAPALAHALANFTWNRVIIGKHHL